MPDNTCGTCRWWLKATLPFAVSMGQCCKAPNMKGFAHITHRLMDCTFEPNLHEPKEKDDE